ncbi:MAG: copper transporter [Limnochordaceae bacterium]|nr:copper transporter [Limnochordaceae bacterium]
MWIEERWHIASLVAIFLALGLGIMVGVAISQSPAVIDKQGEALRHLSVEVAEVRRVQDGLTRRLHQEQIRRQTAERFTRELAAWAMMGRLTGRPVCVVYASPQAEAAAASLRQALPIAGVPDWNEIVLDEGNPQVPWKVIQRRSAPVGASGSRASAGTTVLGETPPSAAESPLSELPRSGSGWASLSLQLRLLLEGPRSFQTEPAPGGGLTDSARGPTGRPQPPGQVSAGPQPPDELPGGVSPPPAPPRNDPAPVVVVVATGAPDDSSKSRLVFHRRLLAELARASPQQPVRLGLAVLDAAAGEPNPPDSTDPAEGTGAQPLPGHPAAVEPGTGAGKSRGGDGVIWLYTQKGALVVDGVQEVAPLAALVTGLSLPGLAGVYGLLPDGPLMPAIPAVVGQQVEKEGADG